MKTKIYFLLVFCSFFIMACSVGRKCVKEKGITMPCECPEFAEHPDYYRVGNFTIRKLYVYNGLYIIYAQKEDSIYKFYSRKERMVPSGGKPLLVDSTYYLCLTPLLFDGLLNKIHFYATVGEYPVKVINVSREYCVKNIFQACNVVSDMVYDSNQCFNIVYSQKYYERKCHKIKRFKEPDIELPVEWDYLPNYK